MKFIFREGKEYYLDFGGTLIEATINNVDSNLEVMRRVIAPIEEVFSKYQKEITRLNNIKNCLLKEKYASSEKNEVDNG